MFEQFCERIITNEGTQHMYTSSASIFLCWDCLVIVWHLADRRRVVWLHLKLVVLLCWLFIFSTYCLFGDCLADNMMVVAAGSRRQRAG